ncbi:MAG: 50S ribosomal protein L11 methyltransferase [Oscillospiraceae bacterium]|nr:50S ribosomal protein L11 methyltransferase [Oscillospiraceae bacterium]
MKWIRIKIETSGGGLEAAAGIFEAAGISSLEIEDSGEFLEELEQMRGSWDYVDEALYEQKSKACSVAAYVTDTEAGKNTLELIKKSAAACNGKNFEVSFAVMDEEDWAESWKKYFVPIPVGKNILICPIWESVPGQYSSRMVFKIDPGMSFGTGTHETTRLCVAALEKYVKGGDSVLDLGCGSGILSIIAAMLGANSTAADIDENCVQTARANAKLNGVPPDRYRAYAGDLLSDDKLRQTLAKQKYDLVLANIVPGVIIALLSFVKDVLLPGGAAVLSGIIGRYVPEVEEAASALGFFVTGKTKENDWHCLEIIKR